MKTVEASQDIVVPEGVTASSKCKVITITGPRGTLTKDFSHINMELQIIEGTPASDEEEATPTVIRVQLWFANRKQLACVRTISSHITNMITGVTKGFLYKMRFVYSHFPINVTLSGNTVEIRNFLGEKRVRKVELCEGVEYVRSSSVKDQIELSGNDLTMVSLAAAKIQQATNVRNKDLRKFLDGIYVSEKGAIATEE